MPYTYGHIPHEKEASVIWIGEKERRARAHETSAKHDSTRGNAEEDHR